MIANVYNNAKITVNVYNKRIFDIRVNIFSKLYF